MGRVVSTKIVAIATNEKTGEQKVYESENIVTDDGDRYYAQRGAGESPDFTPARLILVSGSLTPAKSDNFSDLENFMFAGSQKPLDSTYQKTNDDDSNNSGAGTDVVTYKFSYPAASGTFTGVTTGAVTVVNPTGTDPVLSHFAFPGAPFNKDTNTSLVVFVNHTMEGV